MSRRRRGLPITGRETAIHPEEARIREERARVEAEAKAAREAQEAALPKPEMPA